MTAIPPYTRDQIIYLRFEMETLAAEMEKRGHQGTAKVIRRYYEHTFPMPA